MYFSHVCSNVLFAQTYIGGTVDAQPLSVSNYIMRLNRYPVMLVHFFFTILWSGIHLSPD